MTIERFAVVYAVVWAACAVGTVVFFRKREPRFKKKWHRKVTLINLVIIFGMMAVFLVWLEPPATFIALFIAAALYAFWVSLFQTRVCAWCGHTSQPKNLVTAPSHCDKCGSQV